MSEHKQPPTAFQDLYDQLREEGRRYLEQYVKAAREVLAKLPDRFRPEDHEARSNLTHYRTIRCLTHRLQRALQSPYPLGEEELVCLTADGSPHDRFVNLGIACSALLALTPDWTAQDVRDAVLGLNPPDRHAGVVRELADLPADQLIVRVLDELAPHRTPWMTPEQHLRLRIRTLSASIGTLPGNQVGELQDRWGVKAAAPMALYQEFQTPLFQARDDHDLEVQEFQGALGLGQLNLHPMAANRSLANTPPYEERIKGWWERMGNPVPDPTDPDDYRRWTEEVRQHVSPETWSALFGKKTESTIVERALPVYENQPGNPDLDPNDHVRSVSPIVYMVLHIQDDPITIPDVAKKFAALLERAYRLDLVDGPALAPPFCVKLARFPGMPQTWVIGAFVTCSHTYRLDEIETMTDGMNRLMGADVFHLEGEVPACRPIPVLP